ncbi:hypothetical protein [Ruminococcus sp. XPD3002]|uniref:hypothetical protein n=1 Tax=Ruminococcus sp. XPD3002 TaxID=1452269 RepID=UPI00090F4616|nr:hypothetical protein SAMN04487832_105146 [Ruminococcus flavefaciens]
MKKNIFSIKYLLFLLVLVISIVLICAIGKNQDLNHKSSKSETRIQSTEPLILDM